MTRVVSFTLKQSNTQAGAWYITEKRVQTLSFQTFSDGADFPQKNRKLETTAAASVSSQPHVDAPQTAEDLSWLWLFCCYYQECVCLLSCQNPSHQTEECARTAQCCCWANMRPLLVIVENCWYSRMLPAWPRWSDGTFTARKFSGMCGGRLKK